MSSSSNLLLAATLLFLRGPDDDGVGFWADLVATLNCFLGAGAGGSPAVVVGAVLPGFLLLTTEPNSEEEEEEGEGEEGEYDLESFLASLSLFFFMNEDLYSLDSFA